MKQWQKDALKVIREARNHATRTSDSRLHLACSRTIDAMVKEGGLVPSELRIYARQVRELYGSEPSTIAPGPLVSAHGMSEMDFLQIYNNFPLLKLVESFQAILKLVHLDWFNFTANRDRPGVPDLG